jgi:predicted nucleic acid-binding Zn ribbon protein
MRRSQTQHLGQLLKELARQQNFDGKLKEVDVINYCHEIMGKTMGRYIRKLSVHQGELTIDVTSALVKSELIMLREELRNRLNERIGEEVVTRIIIK